MSSDLALSGQWSLNETAGTAFEAFRGLMVAASSDHVQVLALMACEQFGTTLPICPEVRLKIEQLARPSRKLHVLKFIKAQVGYLAGDATATLSKYEGGIRFLCLAAALQTIGDPFKRAQILEKLLQETASGTQSRPTLGQLKDLFVVLEGKLSHSDFLTNVIGWHDWQCAATEPLESTGFLNKAGALAEPFAPSCQAIENLVIALSTCSRIGDVCGLRIMSRPDFIPWTIAFIKWFTGQAPEVQICNDRDDSSPVCLLAVPSSRILLQQIQSLSSEFVISVERHLENISSLLSTSTAEESKCSGLLDARTWASMQLKSISSWSQVDKQQVGHVMYTLAADLLRLYRPARRFGDAETPPNYEYPMPFRSKEAILQFIEDLFLFEPYMPPTDLDTIPDIIYKIAQRSPELPIYRWLERIGTLTSEVLCLSLFGTDMKYHSLPKLAWRSYSHHTVPWIDVLGVKDDIDRLKKWISEFVDDPFRGCEWPAFAIAQLFCIAYPHQLKSIGGLACSFDSIYSQSLQLLGHTQLTGETDSYHAIETYPRPLISSSKGQVVYPRLIEDSVLSRTGFFDLLCFPGQLLWDGVGYTFAQADRSRVGIYRQEGSANCWTPLPNHPWLSTRQRATLKWHVAPGDGFLDVTLIPNFEDLQSGAMKDSGNVDGWKLIHFLASTVYSLPCSHKHPDNYDCFATTAKIMDISRSPHIARRSVTFSATFLDPTGKSIPLHASEMIFPTHGDNTKRLAVLAALRDVHYYKDSTTNVPSCRIAIHDEGCIKCALTATRGKEFMLLIC